MILLSNIIPWKYVFHESRPTQWILKSYDTDGLVFQHKGICNYSAYYTSLRLQLFMNLVQKRQNMPVANDMFLKYLNAVHL